jgi:hypothetical protein
MSDRVYLEMAEARMLVASYFAAKKTHGVKEANKFLIKQMKPLEKLYGKGVDERLARYMRVITDTEMVEEDT